MIWRFPWRVASILFVGPIRTRTKGAESRRPDYTTLSSSGENKNMLDQATRSLQGRVAQSRMSKSIGSVQLV